MSQAQGKPRATVSRAKLALVAVLALIFVVVLIVQFGGTSSAGQAGRQEDTGENRAPAPNTANAVRQPKRSKEAETTQHSTPRWPILDRAGVLQYDPFAIPAAFARQEDSTDAPPQSQSPRKAARPPEEVIRRKAEQEQALTKLRQEGVAVVVGGVGNDRVAVVGSQTIRIGDLLDGFRVIAIEPDGVVLEKPEQE